MKKSLVLLALVAKVLTLSGCVVYSEKGAPVAATAVDEAQAPNPLLGSAKVYFSDSNSAALLGTEHYANTNDGSMFQCFYDRRGSLNQLILTAYNPTAKLIGTKRLYMAIATHNAALQEGTNDIAASPGNATAALSDSVPKAGSDPTADLTLHQPAEGGCNVDFEKSNDMIEGRAMCYRASLQGRNVDPEVHFRCKLQILE